MDPGVEAAENGTVDDPPLPFRDSASTTRTGKRAYTKIPKVVCYTCWRKNVCGKDGGKPHDTQGGCLRDPSKTSAEALASFRETGIEC